MALMDMESVFEKILPQALRAERSIMGIELHFSTTSKLKQYLENKQWEFDNPEEFYDWIENISQHGIIVDSTGDIYYYQDLCELI